jgi:hypothetical protein
MVGKFSMHLHFAPYTQAGTETDARAHTDARTHLDRGRSKENNE